MTGQVRQFPTGATRDADSRKHDYEGFLSPLVLRAFGAYMHDNRVQRDGSVRDSDNWQKGMPKSQYMKSMFRHFMDVWSIHRGHSPFDFDGAPVGIEQALCGLLFNVMGYLHETLTGRDSERTEPD